jgi:hypothetical protein
MNWGPGAQGGFQNALQMGLQFGAAAGEAKRAREERNALSAYAKDPNEQNFAGLADVRPDIAIQQRQMQAQQAEAARNQQMEQMGTFRQLLEQAGSNPQQAFAAAQQLGIDVSQIPQPGTPEFEPWRQQQLFIMNAVEKEGDNLPGLAREVMFALPEDQRDPNSPAFRQAFTAALENKYAAEYTDAQGNTRRRTIIGQPQQPQQQQGQFAGEIMAFDQFQGMVQSLSPQAAARQVERLSQAGVKFSVASPEQASALPPGTPYITPDGAEYIR